MLWPETRRAWQCLTHCQALICELLTEGSGDLEGFPGTLTIPKNFDHLLFAHLHALPQEKFPLVQELFFAIPQECGCLLKDTLTAELTAVFSSRILGFMEDMRRKGTTSSDKNSEAERLDEPSYPASVEKMSEKWRLIQRQNPDQRQSGFVERNYLALGIGIGLLIIAFLIVIGGFAFLVWNAR